MFDFLRKLFESRELPRRIHFKPSVFEISGKKVTKVITAQENGRTPRHQIFLVFSDHTYIEIYGDDLYVSSMRDGGLGAARADAPLAGGQVTEF